MEGTECPLATEGERPHKRPRCRADGVCTECAPVVQQLRDEMTKMRAELEERLHTYIRTYVKAAIAESREQPDKQVETERPQLKLEAQPETAPAEEPTDSLRCFVCNGPSANMNRYLQVPLDGRCRKQVEHMKHGRPPAARWELWQRALPQMSSNGAKEVMSKLGLSTLAENGAGNVHSSDVADDICTVCFEPIGKGSRVQTLGCSARHTFHHDCVQSWLRESASCPLCREDLTTTCGHPGRLQSTLSSKVGVEADGSDDPGLDQDLLALLATTPAPDDCCIPLEVAGAEPSMFLGTESPLQLERVPSSLLEGFEWEPAVQRQLEDSFELSKQVSNQQLT